MDAKQDCCAKAHSERKPRPRYFLTTTVLPGQPSVNGCRINSARRAHLFVHSSMVVTQSSVWKQIRQLRCFLQMILSGCECLRLPAGFELLPGEGAEVQDAGLSQELFHLSPV